MPRKIELSLKSYEFQSPASRRAANEAFGLEEATMEAHYLRGTELKVVATMEQFGVFIALRNSYGGTNSIKSLDPKPILPAPRRLDVTQHQLTLF